MTKTPVSRGADFAGLARRGVLSIGGASISAVANFAIIVVVTQNFDKEAAGNLFSTTSLFVVLEALCALGTATGLVYFIARLRTLGQTGSIRKVISTAFKPIAAVSMTVAFALIMLAPTLERQLSDTTTDSPSVEALLRVLAMFLPVVVIYDACIAATQGFHTMNPTVVLEKISRPVLQLVLLLAVGAMGAASLLPAAWALPYLVVAVPAAFWLRSLVRAGGSPDESSRTLSPLEFWRYTGPRGIASAAQLCMQRLDIVLVAAMLGASSAALYTAATRFVVVGQLGSQAIALAIQPKYAELLAHNETETTKRVYRTTTAWVMAVTWPVHLFVAVASPIILTIFGSDYASAWPVTVILAVAMLFATSCGMVTMILVMAGKTSWNLINVLVALIANTALNIVLIPRFGIIGAAVAWAIALALANLLPLFQVRRLLEIDPFGRASFLVGTLSIVSFAVVPGLVWVIDGSVVALVTLATVGVALYAAAVWRIRDTLDLDAVFGGVRRRSGTPSGGDS